MTQDEATANHPDHLSGEEVVLCLLCEEETETENACPECGYHSDGGVLCERCVDDFTRGDTTMTPTRFSTEIQTPGPVTEITTSTHARTYLAERGIELRLLVSRTDGAPLSDQEIREAIALIEASESE